MMKKNILGIAAVIIALSASAFTTVKPASKKAAQLYWYEVTYDATHPGGTISSSSAFYVQSEKSQVISPCDAGTVNDCLRGFNAPLTSYPNNSAGMDQIKKPNQ